MRTGLKIAIGIVAAMLLVVVSLGAGWLLFGRRLWMPGGWGAGCAGPDRSGWGRGGWGMMDGRGGWGPGMMGGRGSWGPQAGCPAAGGTVPPAGTALTLEDARDAVEAYVARLGYDLEIAELMAFEHNFYAIVREPDSGMGAMELLVDKDTGAVGPEVGPNMMWNTRYGMHGRGGMMRWSDDEQNSVSAERAVELAQAWLDENKPGVTAEDHADPFYGYYTIHTQRDGQIEGMLSVHGDTGQVWYHTWHGAFVQMIEMDEDAH